MTVLTAADYADTGQWRLIVKIYPSGMTAHIENTIHSDVEPGLLFTAEWDPATDTLLHNIENAVYDHPRVLDDFTAIIIIYDPRTMFIPAELADECEGAEETFYTSLYDVDPADIITDRDGDLVSAYSLAPGLKGFLSRTFPGAKVESNLMHKVRFERRDGKGKRMFVEVRDRETDFTLFDGASLLSASTHVTPSPEDVAYHALNILRTYGVPFKETALSLKGQPLADNVKALFADVCATFTDDTDPNTATK